MKLISSYFFMFILALYKAGLVALTHIPIPMNFLQKILNRPSNERAFLLPPVGYPKFPTYVPDIQRRDLDQIAEYYL